MILSGLLSVYLSVDLYNLGRTKLTLTSFYGCTNTCRMRTLLQAQKAALQEAVNEAIERRRVEDVSHHQGLVS